eukprot:12404144-Karenia_brevis.AAC.1
MDHEGQGSQQEQQALLLQALQSLQSMPPPVQKTADMDDDDLVLANVALPNLSTTPSASSHSGQQQQPTTLPATTADPIQQFDPWQQGASKKRAFGGSPP